MLLIVGACSQEEHHFGGYSKKEIATKLVTHVEPHASAVSLLKRAENSAI